MHCHLADGLRVRLKVLLLEVAELCPTGGVATQQGGHVGPDNPVLLFLGAPPTCGHLPRQIIPTQHIRDRLCARFNKLGSSLKYIRDSKF